MFFLNIFLNIWENKINFPEKIEKSFQVISLLKKLLKFNYKIKKVSKFFRFSCVFSLPSWSI